MMNEWIINIYYIDVRDNLSTKLTKLYYTFFINDFVLNNIRILTQYKRDGAKKPPNQLTTNAYKSTISIGFEN